ncbi:hypothetical protein Tco_1363601, partial [Tanacetum coccineum]
ADFVIVDYESDPCVPLILGRPFLQTARALIDVHGEDMILRERLTLNMRHDTLSNSTQPHQESINMIDVYNVSHEEILKDLFVINNPSGNPTSSLTSHTDLTSPEVNDDIFDPEEDIIENLLNLDKTKDLPPYHDNPLSGNPTLISEPETKSSSSPTLTSIEESDLIWEEFEAYLVDENSLDDNLVDTISEMFTDEHALDYSSPPLWDDYDDELFDLETVNDDTYDDPFYSKSSDFHPFPEYDSVFYEDFSEVDALSLTNNEDKVFNPGILIHENLFEVTNCATMEKNVKMFTDEHALDYSSPPLWDDYDDDLFDHETVNDDTYDDQFDFKEEKIKES